MAPNETEAVVSCYCGANNYSVTLLTSSNPHPVDLCHCSSCRHWSGGMATASIPCSSPPKSVLANLTEYKTSENVNRFFCTNCGSPMHQKLSTSGEWEVNVGVLEDHGALKLVVGAHKHVEDTGDGGLSDFLPKSDGKVLARWEGTRGESQKLPVGWKKAWTASSRTGDDRLWAKCHCGGVQFYITRPNEESKKAFPPGWPATVLGPYPYATSHDPNAETWWLRPLAQATRTQYIAGICGCDTCTRGLGFWFPAWAYVPLCNMVQADGTAVDLDALGTLRSSRRSDSRPGVHRGFCGRCGATVLWWRDDRGPVLDVAVGILRQEDAARAEDWLEWQLDLIVRKSDAREKESIEELLEGMKAYKVVPKD